MLHVGTATIQKYLKPNAAKHAKCDGCHNKHKSLHCHHVDYATGEFRWLCPTCHGRENFKQRLGLGLIKPNNMPASPKFNRKGQPIIKEVVPLTAMEEAQKVVLLKEYHRAKGNISLTARIIGWSRTKTLKMIHRHNLYNAYKHDPWPVEKESK